MSLLGTQSLKQAWNPGPGRMLPCNESDIHYPRYPLREFTPCAPGRSPAMFLARQERPLITRMPRIRWGALPAKFRRLAHHSFPLQLHILKVQEDRQL